MSLQQKFTGTGIAIVTPFLADGSIDWNSYKKLIEFWIKGKVEYLVVLGTTGESATIHGEEKQEVFTFVQQTVNGRIPLMAGIGGNDTAEVLEAFTHYDLTGYDAILSVSPYYNRPSQEGIFQHYKALNEKTPLPLMLYNVPSRTGQNVTAETQLRIARECDKVFGTKEACGNFDQINYLLKYRPEGFLVISGDDGITLPMIACGADGVISVVGNAYPEAFSDMTRHALKGDFKTAAGIHHRLTDIIHTLFAEGSPSGIKAYLDEMNLCGNNFRLPVVSVSDKLRAQIREYIGKF
jgi:4-hydroxy-tetrahydrodipicolinate synthase